MKGLSRWIPVALLGGFALVRLGRVMDIVRQGDASERVLVAVLFAALVAAVAVAVRMSGTRIHSFFDTSEARLAAVVLGVIVTCAVFAPITTSRDPAAQPDPVGQQTLAPSLSHLFGTDQYSRDLFSRMVYGARVSIAVATVAVVVAITLGTVVGLVAGFFGGIIDATLMRLVDAGLAVPRLFFLLVILALWGDVTVPTMVLVLGLTGWFGTSRLVRAEVLSARESTYVQAARGLGFSNTRILFRHLLPNVSAPIIVSATLAIGHMILIEAGLSFLGFGVAPPQASWGTIISDGKGTLLATAPWIATIPGVAIALTVTATGVLGDRLQETLNPRSLR